jgi:hypothetical protein
MVVVTTSGAVVAVVAEFGAGAVARFGTFIFHYKNLQSVPISFCISVLSLSLSLFLQFNV